MKKVKTKDKHALYLASVQDPISDVARLSKIYQEIFKKDAIDFREDFSGTFALSCCWVQSSEERTAIAIDNDHDTIEYGKKYYLPNLSEDEQSRMHVIEGDSISKTKPVDLIAAFNFSYCLLHKRSDLLHYFQKCHESLGPQGMLIMDCFGGSESETPEIQERDIENDKIKPFLFEFERKDFNPITRLSNYGIHFKYPDGTEINDAFTYHFRMWSITEIRDLLDEAGFSKSLIYWEGFDKDGFGNGEFHETEDEENTLNWNALIIGIV